MTQPQPIPRPAPPVGLAADGSIAVDADCLACGYNLRGMDPQGGLCPECGKPVAESFDLRQLRFAPRGQLLHLCSFIRSMAIVPLTPAVGFCFWLLVGWNSFMMEAAITIALPTSLLWFYLPREPAGRAGFPLSSEPRIAAALDRVLQWRRIVAITLLVVLTLIAFAMMGPRSDLASGVELLSLVTLAYVTLSAGSATLLLLSELARRLPAEPVARLLATAGRMMLVFAQVVCGASALSVLWMMTLDPNGLSCLGLVAGGFAVFAASIGGPLLIIITASALAKFANRLTRQLAPPD